MRSDTSGPHNRRGGCLNGSDCALCAGSKRDRYSFAQWVLRQLPPIAAFRPALALLANRKVSEDDPWTVRMLSGYLYTADTRGDLVLDMVRVAGFWDWKGLAVAAIFCRPGDGIVEIGAHAGTETIGFASIVGPRGKVTAFEPGIALCETIRTNVRLNKLSHVDVRCSAIGDRQGMTAFMSADAKNSGSSFVSDESTGQTVPITTLDAEAHGIGKAALLFIDVEGFEVRVLRGASRYLAEHRPAMVLEAYGVALERAGTSLQELVTELHTQRYEIFRVARLGVRPLCDRFAAPEVSENWLCLPCERSGESALVSATLRRYAFSPSAFGQHPIARKARAAARA
jgi:FkbM family methyltransferase